ncbi:MAG TPA: type II secretion system protein [Limnobacter sp.]|uniref:pilin n=1 Tax=Limnobacter sp. TaxID=2003368 RepID=UPI002E2FED61|nr:type II secretion system protein [Limnobacter sp.]HEX5485869.1 type II secretion system protein [Limnobacter sp.]
MNSTFKSRNGNRESGFTLIELMIAIAIVGILASIAVPAFSNYMGRARVSEAVNYAEGCKTGYLEYYSTNGAFPTTNTQANCPTISTDNVRAVTISARGIIIQLANKGTIPKPLQSQYIYLQPLKAGGSKPTAGDNIVAWQCAVGSSAGNNAAITDTTGYDVVPAICRQAPIY